MRPREILAANLNKLMKATPRLETNLKIVQATDGRLSNGKIGRVRLGGKTDIETIGEIAEVFGLQPWQILVDGLVDDDPPALAGAGRTWPFSDELLATVGKLDAADLWYAENALRGSLKMAPLPMPTGNPRRSQQ